MINENDTLTAKQQNENNANAERMKKKNAMVAKILASTAAGMVAGAGAAYAANTFANNENAEETAEETKTDNEATGQETAKPTVEERLSELEEKEREREKQEHARQQQEAERQRYEAERQRQEAERTRKDEERQETHQRTEQKTEGETGGKQENDFFKEHDVKIEDVEQCQIPDGRIVNIYYGTVDGHDAAFADNGNGKITTAIVDQNDNGDIDENERIDLSSRNISAQDMAQHKIEQPEEKPDVTVVSVEHNVNMDGQTVDVASVVIGDTQALLLDTNQNGEVNIVIADSNHNGNIDDGEAGDVSQSHIPMPTKDDIETNLTACGEDGMTDYSNDADTTVYEI